MTEGCESKRICNSESWPTGSVSIYASRPLAYEFLFTFLKGPQTRKDAMHDAGLHEPAKAIRYQRKDLCLIC
jgi:hypothetical protein